MAFKACEVDVLGVLKLLALGLKPRVVAQRSGFSVSFVQKRQQEYGGTVTIRGLVCKRRATELSADDREQILLGVERGESCLAIASRIGKDRSTIWRELARNGGRDNYRLVAAETRAIVKAWRPKPFKIGSNVALCDDVTQLLIRNRSPQQISHELREKYPKQPEMWVSHETIYASVYIQSRGVFRKTLLAETRLRHTSRKTQGSAAGRGKIKNMVMIADRSPEVDDRRVPGHWEGDLIVGKDSKSAAVTLVERSTRFLMIGELPNGHGTDEVIRVLTLLIRRVPLALRKSITWDQGKEMAGHAQFSVAENVAVYFCDPHSPWQRGSNENANGLIRDYIPKGSDISPYTQTDLDMIAAEINDRPRQTLDWMRPSNALQALIDKNVALTA